MFHYIPRLTIEAHGLRKRIANIHHRRVDAAHVLSQCAPRHARLKATPRAASLLRRRYDNDVTSYPASTIALRNASSLTSALHSTWAFLCSRLTSTFVTPAIASSAFVTCATQ